MEYFTNAIIVWNKHHECLKVKPYCLKCKNYVKVSYDYNDFYWECDNCYYSLLEFKLVYYICG